MALVVCERECVLFGYWWCSWNEQTEPEATSDKHLSRDYGTQNFFSIFRWVILPNVFVLSVCFPGAIKFILVSQWLLLLLGLVFVIFIMFLVSDSPVRCCGLGRVQNSGPRFTINNVLMPNAIEINQARQILMIN